MRSQVRLAGGCPPSTTQLTASSAPSFTGKNKFPGSRRLPSTARNSDLGGSETQIKLNDIIKGFEILDRINELFYQFFRNVTQVHNEELHSMYRSPNIVRVIKSRRLRWAGHVAKMEEGRSALKILTVNLQERDLWGGLGVDGRTISERALKR